MKRFLMLTFLEVKRYIKAFPTLLFAAVVLGIVVCGIGITGQKTLDGAAIEDVEGLVDDITASSDSANGKITAALVIQDESKAIPYAKKLLEKMESIQALLNICYVDEEEGERMLADGEAAVLIIMREKTISGIMHGDNIPVEVKFPEDSGYEAVIFKEFADAAINMLSASQAAVYSVYDFYDEYDEYDNKGDAIDYLNMAYISAALNRHKLFEQQEVMVTGEVTTSQYYLAGSIVLFVLFYSIMLVHFMERRGNNVSVGLKRSGTGYWLQNLGALVGPVLTYMGMSVLLALIMTCYNKDGEALDVITNGQIWQIIGLMLPMGLMVSAFTLMICRLTGNTMAQIMCLFLVSLMQGFVAGCFVPKILLPEQLGVVASYLPAGHMINAVTSVFVEGQMAESVAILCGFAVVFYVIAVLTDIRRKNS